MDTTSQIHETSVVLVQIFKHFETLEGGTIPDALFERLRTLPFCDLLELSIELECTDANQPPSGGAPALIESAIARSRRATAAKRDRAA